VTTSKNSRTDMTTASGVFVCFDDLASLDVRTEDIRLATSNICRYNGFLDWRLLWHLALCTMLAEHYQKTGQVKDELTPAFAAMHDFHEVYVGDMTSGLKKYCPDYCLIEDQAEIAVHDFFGLSLVKRNKSEVRYVDLRALVLEMWCLGHPARIRCAGLYGGTPTQEEIDIFEAVRKWTADECWEAVIGAVFDGVVRSKIEDEAEIPF
jgi:hypothetical protein